MLFYYEITFYFTNNTERSFQYYDLLDILYDLKHDLSNLDNSCEFWIIERIFND